MNAVAIGESSGASREAIMDVYPRHNAIVDTFVARMQDPLEVRPDRARR